MKDQIRVLGIDDSPFKFTDKRSKGQIPIIGVVLRIPAYIEGILKSEVTIDGTDATEILIEMINGSHFKKQLKLIMLDGVALGGFNVVDLQQLYEKTGIPAATITRSEPDFTAIQAALKKHFKDWETRLKTITDGKLITISTEYSPIHVKFTGIPQNELEELIQLTTVRGVLPEPIRIAHLIASGITTGESYGKA
ncbi:MAG: DUF99 family protein [Thermoplasmata archaeon]|nr:DUF99 family protein [Thermoplasmata archaeon]